MGEDTTDKIDSITNMLSWFKDLPESTSAKALYEHVDNIDQHVQELEEALNTEIATKVDKIEGKGLSTNDFTDALLKKLNDIAANANNYSLPTATNSTLGGVKIGSNININSGTISVTVDSSLSSTSTNPV